MTSNKTSLCLIGFLESGKEIESGLRARGSKLPVLHVVEVLDRAMS